MDVDSGIEENTSGGHVQAKFFSKQKEYAVPSTPFSVPVTVDTAQLNSLIKSLLQSYSATSAEMMEVDFDFLINGEILRVPLETLLQDKEISTEDLLEVEYVVRQVAPKALNSLQHDDWVSAVCANRNSILTGCYDNSMHLWTLKGEHVTNFSAHSGAVKAVAWMGRDSAEMFVSASYDQTAAIWSCIDKTDMRCLGICRGHSRSVDCVAVQRKEELPLFATGSFDCTLKIWSSKIDEFASQSVEKGFKKSRVESGSDHPPVTITPVITVAGHREAVSSVDWMDEGSVCTAGMDHTIRLWDVQVGTEKSLLQGSKSFLSLSYSQHTKQLVTGSVDRHIRLWDTRGTQASLVQATFTSHNGWISSVNWSETNEHQFISASFDGIMKLWDVRSCKACLYDMEGHTDKILCTNWSNPEFMLSGGADSQLKVFNA